MTRNICLIVYIFTFGWCEATFASDFAAISECQRPEPGTVAGACAVRSNPEIHEQSPYPMLRWAACLQKSLRLPSGGSRDAIFFRDLASEYEIEIEANLKTLEKILTEKDRKALKHEQLRWVTAREQAGGKRAKEGMPAGTMYQVFSSATALTFPEDRAIELACRVEKLKEK